jgi:hypothetical protein
MEDILLYMMMVCSLRVPEDVGRERHKKGNRMTVYPGRSNRSAKPNTNDYFDLALTFLSMSISFISLYL